MYQYMDKIIFIHVLTGFSVRSSARNTDGFTVSYSCYVMLAICNNDFFPHASTVTPVK